MILKKILKVSDSALENYVVITKDKWNSFTYQDHSKLVEFLEKLERKIAAVIQSKEKEIEEIEEADAKNPDKIRNNKGIHRVISIIGTIIFGILGYEIVKYGFSYTLLEYKILSILSLIPTGIFTGVACDRIAEKLSRNPKIEKLESQVEELGQEGTLVEKLLDHLTTNPSMRTEKDIFSIADEKKPGIFRKLRLRLGKQPESFKENGFYRDVNANRVKKFALKMKRNKAEQKRIPLDIRNAVDSNEKVDAVFTSRKADAQERANDARRKYNSRRFAVTKSYVKRRKFFESRYFDEALESNTKVSAKELEVLETIIDGEIERNKSSETELLAYKDAFKESLKANTDFNEYENNPSAVRRRIKNKMQYLKHLLSRYKTLEAKKEKASKESEAFYVKTYLPKK